uniref:Uncharacterized protein n=1 Tax=Timema poppense TaxID=170557 RepID=A0A7R9D1F2_TIMPO|nr:unnamed protein product [Timema poppensis]
MEEEDRKAITHSLVLLVQLTDLDNVVPKLVEKGVFSQRMVQKYTNPNIKDYLDRRDSANPPFDLNCLLYGVSYERDGPLGLYSELDTNRPLSQRKRELYLDIQLRGPRAFDKLLETLSETNHLLLAQVLRAEPRVMAEHGEETSHHVGVHPMFLPQYLGADPLYIDKLHNMVLEENNYFSMGTEPLSVKVKLGAKRMDYPCKKDIQVYPMGSRPKGHFLIINNVKFWDDSQTERKGGEVDEHNLVSLFGQLGYEVHTYRNLSLSGNVRARATKSTLTGISRSRSNCPLIYSPRWSHGLRHNSCDIKTVNDEIREMKKRIVEFAQMQSHENVDSCVVSILSHGEADGDVRATYIITADGEKLSTEWVIEQFKNQNCPLLVDRPKIFLFQNCRHPDYSSPVTCLVLTDNPQLRADGFEKSPDQIMVHTYQSDAGVGSRGTETDYGMKLTGGGRTQFDGIPNKRVRSSYSDMLIAHSTLPGYTSNRDIYRGTWFVQAICKIFMEHAHDTDVEDMLKMVDQKLANSASEVHSMQTSCYENRGFRRKFYFNPGIYSDTEQDQL